MKEYTLGKKGVVLVIHQLFLVIMVTSLFTMGYMIHAEYWQGGFVYSIIAVVGLVGTFLALAYLTNSSGKHSEQDPTIYLHKIDKIGSDAMIILFILFSWLSSRAMLKIRGQDYGLSGLLVAVGTVAYLMDVIFLEFYLSFVRRLKADTLFTGSFIYAAYSYWKEKRKSEERIPFTNRGRQQLKIQKAVESIANGALDTRLELSEFTGRELELADAVNHIRDGLSHAVAERVKNEQMKADLITNVSHDIKTPLTSIVNYVDLLKRENLDNENARNYIRIIDEKSQRLKQLTEDLVEASKISSGNVKLDMQNIDFVELLYQTGGEFNERFEARNLTIVTKLPKNSIFIEADGRQLYRAIENLYTNAAKYAMEKTRVYVELEEREGEAIFTMKNICKNQIPEERADGDSLTERFVRGEVSRTTEGSGLGLSIAKNLTQLMGGKLIIKVDGDVFLASILFPVNR